MSCATRLGTAAVTAVVLIAPPVIAKPACNATRVQDAVSTVTARAATGPVELQRCSRNCLSQMGNVTETDDVPAPAHLPVVSSPDEIASWHAEIFDRLSQSDGDDHKLCKLDI